MYTSRALEFHIICDTAAEQHLRHRLAIVEYPPYPVHVVFHKLSPEAMKGRLQREGAIVTDHSAGIRACRARPRPARPADRPRAQRA
jgi:hypothetical protein